MKKFLSAFMAMLMAASVVMGFTVAYAESVELDEIYSEYGLGETLVVRGSISKSGAVVLLLDPNMQPCYWEVVSRETISEGLNIAFGPEREWILGEYLLKVSYGTDFVQEYHIDLVEGPVDRTPEVTAGGVKKNVTATAISISPAKLKLKVGETADVKILTNNTAVTWETDDMDKITISGTSDAKVTAKKTGTAIAWAYSGNNYATLMVEITPGDKAPAINEPQKPEEEKKQLFTDIADVEWAEESINSLAEAKVINGMGGGLFAPNDSVTRAQFVKMIVQAFGFEGKGSASFDDVSEENDWFAESVLIAANNGIVNGYGGNFKPNDNISCQDAALIIKRVLVMKEINLPAPDGSEAEAAEYAREAVGILRSAGIITDKMSFSPKVNATRAQSAFMIYGAYKLRNEIGEANGRW